MRLCKRNERNKDDNKCVKIGMNGKNIVRKGKTEKEVKIQTEVKISKR